MEIGILGRFDNDKKEEIHLRFMTKDYIKNEMSPSKVLTPDKKEVHLKGNMKGE